MTGYNFSERVRKVLALAREEATGLRHEYVATEHILLGLIREGGGVGYAVLENLVHDLDTVRSRIIDAVKRGEGPAPTGPDLPYTSRAKKSLELAMAEARELRHSYVGTEHLLLGLIREGSGIAAQVLLEFGVDRDKARGESLRLLGPGPGVDLDDDEKARMGAVAHTHPAPLCPDCDVDMEPGVLLDRPGNAVARWASGRPSRGFWQSVRAQRASQMSVMAFRCPRCGYLRLIAGPE